MTVKNQKNADCFGGVEVSNSLFVGLWEIIHEFVIILL
jgi:hypothetical protein